MFGLFNRKSKPQKRVDVHPSKSTVKLMWDYGCWPVWKYDGEIFDNVSPESLPLCPATRDRLARWAAVPDSKYERHKDCPQDMVWTDEETQMFEAEGRELWSILQRELGAGFYVVYHSTTARRVLSPENEDMV